MIQLTRNENTTTSATSKEIVHENMYRRAIYLTNTSGAAITISKGVAPAVLNEGIVLQLNCTWFETDSEGFGCWKGAIQVIGSGAGTLAISETSEV